MSLATPNLAFESLEPLNCHNCNESNVSSLWISLTFISHPAENHAFIKFDIILKYNIEFKINTYIVGAPEHLGTRGIVQNKVWPKIQFSLFSHRFYLNVFRGFVQWNFRTFHRPCIKQMKMPDNIGILFLKLFWLTWERIVLVIEKTFGIRGWRPRICKNFEITRKIYSNSEKSEQFLVTECFLTWRFLRSNNLEHLEFELEKNIRIQKHAG